jgi:hypothetical protein
MQAECCLLNSLPRSATIFSDAAAQYLRHGRKSRFPSAKPRAGLRGKKNEAALQHSETDEQRKGLFRDSATPDATSRSSPGEPTLGGTDATAASRWLGKFGRTGATAEIVVFIRAVPTAALAPECLSLQDTDCGEVGRQN